VPNFITLLRILLVPFLFSTLLYYEPGKDHLRLWAFFLFLVGTLTDAVDGLVARLQNQTTQLGKFLDPLADKLLLLSAYMGILFAREFPLTPPVWVVVTIVFRDLVILVGLVVLFVSTGHVEVNPNLLGKATTAFQMVTMLSILLLFPTSRILWNVTAALTVVSGFVYVAREMSRTRRSG
jgi:CDP-diacylglycerol--glycerol-3-phosphate 3-phosphatidyltransferase